MPIYELTLQAESDIRDIIRYTLERHGEKQALCYKNALQKKFCAIAERAVHSRPLSERFPQIQVSRCEHHYIFYVHPESKPPRIIAVLHERMDLLTRLANRLN
ncbi:type II toxin-antitoxin system RelE/ParE family toxin [Methylotuvimicrobium alcaliphilum]|uniref:Plasmid stabilization system n=1 Tax=Methylotuvimicrobium alcaliphilum (strain DSM 19304 / NCIMB 14124 / VKM B-2133 / 20Z) TaxID=1091494 RepID=G4SVD3_META2|nr:type II toxin-antitoxin system RelE/ParE family toxin [Methylotuvimicrobium alcaliphilum]CCE21905.1 Plasmid stabilization system [Methylotuvimicrobium alcaliphilum 20Z]